MGWRDRFRRGREPKPRVAVIGLDGVGTPLIEALTDAGVMPRMAALRRVGTLARMTSSFPTISNVSWSGFMTGVNPGRHGIYGFTDVRRDSYAVSFPNYTNVRAPTLWDALGARGKTSIVLNVPGTYPAKDITGVLVSGFVAVTHGTRRSARERARGTASAGLQDRRRLRERRSATGGVLHRPLRDPGGPPADPPALPRHLRLGLLHRRHHRDRSAAPLFLARVRPTGGIPCTSASSTSMPRSTRAIGELADVLGDETPLFIIADHGHTAIETECYPNAWLRAEDLLRFETATPKSLADLDASLVGVHARPRSRLREPEGTLRGVAWSRPATRPRRCWRA